jgi:hypothetical protein
MSFKVRDNNSAIFGAIGRNNFNPKTKDLIGKIYGVVTTYNTPTEKQFQRAGGFGGIGTVLYLDYENSKNITGSVDDSFLDTCDLALPINSQMPYPLLHELVYLLTLPTPSSKPTSITRRAKYYINPINIWNNTQQNALPTSKNDILGTNYTEDANTRPLLNFEGDYVIQGRKGNAIRFSNTATAFRDISDWNSIGKNNDPILILSNGFNYDKKSQYYVEQINKDKSSIYLTSAQKIPLNTDKIGVLNNITNPVGVSNYFSAQIILNSDRVVLNSKKDEVMIFAKTNIELNTKNVINLNADARVHLNSNAVFLGTYDENNIPQPVLLGNNTIRLLQNLQRTLTTLGQYFASASSTKEGSPLPNINAAGKELLEDMKSMAEQLDNITSKRVFTT